MVYHLVLYLNLQDVSQRRVFKTRWFSKVAKSHAIDDSELCKTVQAAMQGKADDLGGESIKSGLIIIAIGLLFWQRVGSIGITLISMPSRIKPISIEAN